MAKRILENAFLATTPQRLVRLREILYEDALSDHNDGRTSKISNFKNSKWRTDLQRNITDGCTTIYCLGRALIVWTYRSDKLIVWYNNGSSALWIRSANGARTSYQCYRSWPLLRVLKKRHQVLDIGNESWSIGSSCSSVLWFRANCIALMRDRLHRRMSDFNKLCTLATSAWTRSHRLSSRAIS